MKVKRIVGNIQAADPAQAHVFYGEVLGLELAMDHGWIRTCTGDAKMTVQVSVGRLVNVLQHG